jgi:hypothetical protein
MALALGCDVTAGPSFRLAEESDAVILQVHAGVLRLDSRLMSRKPAKKRPLYCMIPTSVARGSFWMATIPWAT